VGGCLAFDIGAEGEDDFVGEFECDASDELIDTELVRADMVERGEATAEGVVEAGKDAAAFQWEDVCGMFNDADFLAMA
jgi:hypothetical protein